MNEKMAKAAMTDMIGNNNSSEIEAAQAAEDAARCRAVEEALFRRACGYQIAVKKVFKLKQVDYDDQTGKKLSEREVLEVGEEEEHIPADVRVCAYYLNNRSPDRWQEHPEAEEEATEAGGVVLIPRTESITSPEISSGESRE